MDVKYPEPHCNCGPAGTHWFEPIVTGIWRCKFCWVVKWMPTSWLEARAYPFVSNRKDVQRTYTQSLQQRPKIREQLIKLEKIRLLRGTVADDKLAEMAAAIMISKE